MSRPRPLTVVATFALLSLIWGTTWAAIRVGLRGIPPFTGVALRFAVASAVLFAVSPWFKVRYRLTPVAVRLWLLNGALSFCASYGVVYWSEQWIPSGLASVLFATFPLFVAMFAHFVLPEERLGPRQVGGILAGFAGVAVIFSEDFGRLGGGEVALAAAVMLVSPLVSAISSVAIKRWGRDVHPVSLSSVPMAISVPVMTAVAFATERDAAPVFDAASVGALLYLALLGSALTFSLYYWLMAHLPATRLSLIAYTTPVVAVAFGSAFMDEPLTARTAAGSALVVAGVALAAHGRGREAAPAEAP